MFYTLNKKKILQLIIALALLVWAIFTIVTQMTVCQTDGQTFICQNFFSYLQQHTAIMKGLAIFMLLLEVLFVQRYYESNKFPDNQTYMPIVMLLLFVNVSHSLTVFTPAHLSVLMLSFILLFNTRDENDRSSYNRVFSSGILIGLATLFDPAAIWLLLFLMLMIFSNQFSKAKEVLILLFGFLIVAIYLFSTMFLKDSFPILQHSLKYLYTFVPLKQLSQTAVIEIVSMGVVLLFTIIIGIVTKIYFDSKLVVLRKRFTTVHFLLFVMIVMMLFSGLSLRSATIYLMLPITIYTSVLCLNKNRVFVHDAILVLLFVALWL